MFNQVLHIKSSVKSESGFSFAIASQPFEVFFAKFLNQTIAVQISESALEPIHSQNIEKTRVKLSHHPK